MFLDHKKFIFERSIMNRVYLLFMLAFATNCGARDGVVLLHGLCRSDTSMKKMEAALLKSGFYVENMSYPSRVASVEKLSDGVMKRVMENKELGKCRQIHFVTHSMGGILVRSYLQRHDFPKLGRVVMLGPPNQGSEVVDKIGGWWSFRKLNGPAGNELGTDTNSTPNRLGPVDFELGVIAGDRSINWINSCMIKEKDDGKVSVERTKVEGMKDHIVIHATHPYLMKNRDVIENTIRFLRTGAFSETTNVKQ